MTEGKKSQHDYMFKVILIGSSGVGKSNILLKYTRNQFNPSHQTTIGVEYAAKNVEVNLKLIRLQIWDTVGQQQYRAIMKTFYKGASAVFLTYDITNQKSFQDLDYWYKQIKEYSKSEILIMLVGNKSDLEEQRVISKQRGLEYAQKNKIAFYEVSAKEGINIELIFNKIAQELEKIMQEVEKSKKGSVIMQEVEQVETKGKSKGKREEEDGNIVLKTNDAKKGKESAAKKGKCCSSN